MSQRQHMPQRGATVSLSQTQTTITVSPIPTPDDMHKYNAVHPGFAERLMVTYEKEQEARLMQNNLKLKGQLASERRAHIQNMTGMVFGLVTVFSICGLSCYFAWLGNIEWAAKTTIGSMAAVVGIFVVRRFFAQRSPKPEE
jgi:uncharacterized membrane protein